jgi:hypothetical protein
VPRAHRVQVEECLLRDPGNLLREARQRDDYRGPGDLRAFAQKKGEVLIAEDALDTGLLIEATQPNLGPIRQREVLKLNVRLQLQPRKALLHHHRDRLQPHRGPGRVRPEAQDRVARRGTERPMKDRLGEKKRLSGARTPDEHRVADRQRQDL